IVYPFSTKRRHATPNLLGLKPLEATGASVHAIALVNPLSERFSVPADALSEPCQTSSGRRKTYCTAPADCRIRGQDFSK
ncbi:hypothetical protein, partial [Azotobacter armeniacus]